MKKRIVSIILTLALCLSLPPAAAQAAETTTYNIWVGGVQVSGIPDENGNITVTGNTITGTVTYAPSTGTLTLSGATIAAAATPVDVDYGNTPPCGVYSRSALNLVLTGESTITASTTDYSNGVKTDTMDLTISGGGSLEINTCGYGIKANSLVTDDVTLEIIGSVYAISLNTGCTITDSTVSAVGSTEGISTINGTIEIDNSSVYVKGEKNSFYGTLEGVSVSLSGAAHVEAVGAIRENVGVNSDGSGYLRGASDGTFTLQSSGSLEYSGDYFEYLGAEHYTFSPIAGSEEHAIICADTSCGLQLENAVLPHIWNGAACAGCKAAAAASVTASGTTDYYYNFQNALAAADGSSGAVLKLFANVETVAVSTGGFILDPNGKSVTKLEFGDDSQPIGITSKPGNTPAVSAVDYGVFATPSGVTLEAAWFTSATTGYVVVKNGNDLELVPGITKDMVTVAESATYNGSIQTPAVTVRWTDGNGVYMNLTEGQHYAVGYKDSKGDQVFPTNAGAYTVIITGMGDYAGEVKKTYTISPKSLEGAAVTAPDQTYTGSKLTPAVTVELTGYTITSDDYDVSYSSDTLTNAGSYTITVTGKGNFAGTASGTFAITPVDISDCTANSPDQTTIFGVGDFTEPTIPGVAGETVPGTFQYSITAANGATAVTGGDAAAVKASLAKLDKDASVTVNWTFSPTTGNYTGTKAGSFTVTAKDIVFEIGGETASADNAIHVLATTYGPTWSGLISVKNGVAASVDGAPVSGAYTIVPGSGALSDRPGAGTHTYTVTFTGGNYTNVTVFSGSITVERATITITAKDQSIYVGGTAPDLSSPALNTHYTVSGLVSGDTLGGTITMEYQTGGAAATPDTSKTGTYDIVISGATVPTGGNYNEQITFTPGTLTISTRPSSGGGGYTPPAKTEPETGSSGGWNEIQDELTDLVDAIDSGEIESGETVTVEMNGATEVPAEVLSEIAGKDVNVEFDMGGGIVWEVNGQDIPAGIGSLNLGISTGGNSIPVNVINTITGETATMQLELSHDGPFGTTLHLSLALGEENRGYWANLYYYDGKDLHFRHACRIDETGRASWPFDHASSYAVVIDNENHDPEWVNPFTDVKETDWFYEAVAYVNKNGLMAGTSTTERLFSPDGITTRAQIVTILHRLEGSPINGQGKSGTFVDVPEYQWYTEAVEWAAASGITSGTGDGTTFSPNDPITREQLAAFLYRYAQHKGGGFTGLWAFRLEFEDVAALSDWAYEPMCWCVMNGIITGIEKDGSMYLDPQGSATRAQAAQMLKNFIEKVAK